MIALFCLFLISYFFGSQLLAEFLRVFTVAKGLEPGPWDLKLSAERRRTPKIFLMKDANIESLILSNSFGQYAFLTQDLWDAWSPSERATFVFWCASARLYSSNLGRILWGFNLAAVDRNAALESDDKLAIVGMLEKSAHERLKRQSGFLTGSLSGLSLLGPSFFYTWPTVPQRLKDLIFHLSKLEKAR